MTEKELRKLNRYQLLELLVMQTEQNQALRDQVAQLQLQLEQRQARIEKLGSIAEASLQLSGIFDAAQESCRHYIENIRLLSQRQSAVCAQLERESREKAAVMLAETAQSCDAMESEAKVRCAEMTAKAKAESQSYWDEVAGRLDAYYQQHAGLRELLSVPLKPTMPE